MKEYRVYRVQVLLPLAPRQRKHSVHLFRVGAKSREAAIEAVRARLIEYQRPDWTIVDCTEFGRIDSVVLDGVYTMTKERAASLKPL